MLSSSGGDGRRRASLSCRWSCTGLVVVVVGSSPRVRVVIVIVIFAAPNQNCLQCEINSLPAYIRGEEGLRVAIRYRGQCGQGANRAQGLGLVYRQSTRTCERFQQTLDSARELRSCSALRKPPQNVRGIARLLGCTFARAELQQLLEELIIAWLIIIVLLFDKKKS
jgi:hypothetical protein